VNPGQQPESVIIVGASLAGLSTARALRSRGFVGQLTIVGDEVHRPYDRPPLSKEFLRSVDVAFEPLEADGEDLVAAWILGVRAVALRPRTRGGADLALSDGREIGADAVVLATGASARCNLPGAQLPGVHLLRTADDASALRSDLHEAAGTGKPVVVVGGGFIGSEVASTARELGCEVTLVVPDDVPLRAALGPYADAVARLHVDHGVVIRADARVREVRRSAASSLEVVLADGANVAANTVVLGIGAAPAVGWLADSGLDLGERRVDAIRCDEHGGTNFAGVYAVGDCAAWFNPGLGYHYQIEHWTSAKERGAQVAAHLLGSEDRPAARPPFVWSDLYGKRIQLAGYRDLADHPDDPAHTIEVGSIAEGSFAAVYRREGAPIAVLALDQPRQFAGVRRKLTIPVHAPAAGVSDDHPRRSRSDP
jgi:NADPH-dependent 2,4-dienoyl-CoA reductase/sulfur reductase-like enzyme